MVSPAWGGPGVTLTITLTKGHSVSTTISGTGSYSVSGIIASAQASISAGITWSKTSTRASRQPSLTTAVADHERARDLARLEDGDTRIPGGRPLFIGSGRGTMSQSLAADTHDVTLILRCGGAGSATVFGDDTNKPIMAVAGCEDNAIYKGGIPANDVTKHRITVKVDPKTTWTVGIWRGDT